MGFAVNLVFDIIAVITIMGLIEPGLQCCQTEAEALQVCKSEYIVRCLNTQGWKTQAGSPLPFYASFGSSVGSSSLDSYSVDIRAHSRAPNDYTCPQPYLKIADIVWSHTFDDARVHTITSQIPGDRAHSLAYDWQLDMIMQC